MPRWVSALATPGAPPPPVDVKWVAGPQGHEIGQLRALLARLAYAQDRRRRRAESCRHGHEPERRPPIMSMLGLREIVLEGLVLCELGTSCRAGVRGRAPPVPTISRLSVDVNRSDGFITPYRSDV